MSSPRRPHLGLLVGLALVAAACSVPLDDGARQLARPLPEALLPAESTTTSAPPPATQTVQIFLSRTAEDGRTVRVEVDREVATGASLAEILNKVVEGPNAADAGAVTAPFGDGTQVVDARLPDGSTVLEVELSGLDGFPSDSDAGALAWGLLVCTSTELLAGPEIAGVRFFAPTDADERTPVAVKVPVGDPPGEGQPVSCADYEFYDPSVPIPSPPSTSIAPPDTSSNA